MNHGEIKVVEDVIADQLDEMSLLGEHWLRNREAGRMPRGIRAGMICLAESIVLDVKIQGLKDE